MTSLQMASRDKETKPIDTAAKPDNSKPAETPEPTINQEGGIQEEKPENILLE